MLRPEGLIRKVLVGSMSNTKVLFVSKSIEIDVASTKCCLLPKCDFLSILFSSKSDFGKLLKGQLSLDVFQKERNRFRGFVLNFC